ncbi:MAG: alkaline phosphatase family protein [Opitutaceae bacterium]
MPTRALRPTLILAVLVTVAPFAYANAKHVVVIVWDGMRPDFVSERLTPVLYKLAHRGVFFQNHHSSFVTSTEVNGAVFGTGTYPGHSGLIANIEYRPAIDPTRILEMESTAVVGKGDDVSGGRYLATPTVAEILREQTPPLRSVIAGAKAVAILLDRSRRRPEGGLPVLVEGQTYPSAAKVALTSRLGEFPAVGETKAARDTWTTRAMIEEYWHDGIPPYSHLWLAEPDWSQHHTGPGSATSLSGIAECDQQLGRIIKELTRQQSLSDTDVLVVSDHGFSTIGRTVDLAVDLSKAGLTTARAYAETPAVGTILVAGLGASASLYVAGHDPSAIRRAVSFLQTQDYTGVIFTRDGINGTFPFSLAKIDSKTAPDILVSLKWTRDESSTGTPGLEGSEQGAGRKVGEGTHAGLSPYDLHNTLVAAGPDFRTGMSDTLASGNVDVAPTVLWILGVKPAQPMDGRVLTEALTIAGPPVGNAVKHRAEADAKEPTGTWEQYLETTEVNGVRYFDAGNGALKRK